MAATATAASACAGASRNCELLIGLHELHAQGCAQAGITGPDAVVNAAAVGLVIEVWRNGPVEDMHAVLLDRTRSWAGTGGKTLKYPGYGFLGEYDRHVKDRVSALMTLDDHTCVSVPLDLYLVSRALVYGRNHKGMPGWREIVDRIGALLADPTHPAWRDPDRGAHALATMPRQLSSLDRLTATLRAAPSTLPVEVLEWLSDHLLYCAGPPYGLCWEG